MEFLVAHLGAVRRTVVLLVVFPCILQSLPNQVQIGLWSSNTLLGLLLKNMQHINSSLQFHGVHGSERVSGIADNDLNDVV